MGKRRKTHTVAFEAQVALAAVLGDKTINELAGLHGLHPTPIRSWKKQFLPNAEEFDVGNGRRSYINPGPGYLRRVRFGVRPEITAFRLARA